MSLNFVILRHVGVISHQERQVQKSYKVDFTGPPCSRTDMHSARLVKIVKSFVYGGGNLRLMGGMSITIFIITSMII